MSKYFYHGLKKDMFREFQLEKMLEIINSGAIKNKRLLGIKVAHGYNGIDYISLCRKEDIEEYIKYPYNSFFTFIHNNCCFIISDDISAIKTCYIDRDKFEDYWQIEQLMLSNPEIRYSDMFDEWQFKGSISLDCVIGVGIPLERYERRAREDTEFKELLNRFMDAINLFNWDLVDTSSFYFVEEYEESKTKNMENNIKKIEFKKNI